MSARPYLASIARFLLIVSCLALLLVLAVALLPIYLDLAPVKGWVEGILTSFVEAPVTVDRVRARVGLRPTIRLSGVSVEGSGREDAPRFTHVDFAEIQLSLIPLLGKELRVGRLRASGARFRIDRPRGQRGNWPVWTEIDWRIAALDDIEFRDLQVDVSDHQVGGGRILIDSLTCAISEERPLALELQGSIGGLPLSLAAGGPTLADFSPKATDFPLSLELQISDLSLTLDGSASREPEATRVDLELRVSSEQLTFARKLGAGGLPAVGGLKLAGRLSNRATGFAVDDLEGMLGETSVRGRLAVDWAEERPRLTGRLALGRLDLTPWRGTGTPKQRVENRQLPWSLLGGLDATVDVQLDELVGLDLGVEAVTANLEIDAGTLELPLGLRVAGIPFEVTLGADARAAPPTVSARAQARDLSIGQLAKLVDLPDNLRGTLGRVELAADSSGGTVGELLDQLAFTVDIGDAELIIAEETGEQPIELSLERIGVRQKRRQAIELSASGRLADTAFDLEADTAALETLRVATTWPIRGSVEGAGAQIDLEGEITLAGDTPNLDVDASLRGQRIGDLSAWLGISPEAQLEYNLRGHLLARDGSRFVRLDEMIVGRTRFSGSFEWSALDDRPLSAEIQATVLDPQELWLLFDPVTELDTEREALGFDVPVLPSRIDFRNADLDFQADRIHRGTLDLTRVSAALLLRGGRLERSPFAFRYGANEFSGHLELDLSGETPELALAFAGGEQDLGDLLDHEEIASDLRATARRLDLDLTARGSTLREIFRTIDVSASLEDVRWRGRVPETDREVEVRFPRIDLEGSAGEPIVVTADGRIAQEPLTLRLELRPGEPSDADNRDVLFRLLSRIAETSVELDGGITLPLVRTDLEARAEVAGERLDTLSTLLERPLPPFGPYRMTGQLSLAEGQYSLTDLELRLGESDLSGEIRYTSLGERPWVAAELESKQIRMQDLLPEEETPGNAAKGLDTDPKAGTANDRPTTRDGAGDVDRQADRVTPGPTEPRSMIELLDAFDASIALEVNQLVATGGAIDAFELEATLETGDLDLLLRRTTPDGQSVDFAVDIAPAARGIEARVRSRWQRLPYGVLADLLQPGEREGSLSADLDLRTQGSSVDELLSNLAGHLDFTDYPKDFRATILDLWGGGFVDSLLPVFQLGSESRINCTVGRFLLSDGVMIPELLLVDTTRSRVRGKGQIDLGSRKLDLRLRPRPKKPSLVNLATPVRVIGPLENPSVRFTTGGAALTYFRLTLWIYTVWADLIRKPLPADGRDICLDPPLR